MPVPKTPQEIQMFNGMAQFYRCFIKKKSLLWHELPSHSEKLKYLSGLLNVKSLGKTSRIDTFKLLHS
jgi:hypothetical protein